MFVSPRNRLVSSAAISIAVTLIVTSGASAQTTCGGATGPDVIVGIINGVANYGANGSLEALSLGTTSCNMGTADLQWNQCGSLTHPVIGGNLYKWSTVNGATRFEQVGQSWLKNAFLALTDSDCCSCNGHGGSVLGVGCSDPYQASRNGDQTGLGPKYAVNAHTGVYTSTECNVRPSGGNNGRIEVSTTDLVATSGGSGASTRYFGQAQYVTPDDASNHNQNNNASWIEITVSGSGSAWTFGSLGSTSRQNPAIRHWKEIDSGVVETNISTPEDDAFTGLVILSAKATNLGGGIYHYEYAINNLNSDRSIGYFSVPVPASATVTNIGFHDVAYRYGDGVNAAGTGGTSYDGTDWPGSFAGGAVTWATQTYAVNRGANAIRWGNLFNFRFDANVAPNATTGNVTLQEFKNPSGGGSPPTLTALTVIPIQCAGPVINSIHDDSASCGVNYTSGNPSLSSGTGPITWSLGAGSPAGMTINPGTGAVTWPVPVMTGSPYTITTKATNDCGTGSQTWQLTVNANPPTINPIQNTYATCGASYTSAVPTTTGGAAPFTWALDSGPSGMTIDGATGAVSWPNPVATGSPFTVTIHADSANGCGSSSQVSWSIGVVIGDFTNDGLIKSDDIDPFASNLLLDSPVCAGDLNGDGLVDGNDIAPFIAALGL